MTIYKIVANCFKKTVLERPAYAIISGCLFVYAKKRGKRQEAPRGKASPAEKGRKSMAQSLILASSSPRRRELMEGTGLPFQVITADAEELKEGEPKALVMENARRKALEVWKLHPGCLVLGADTVVYQGDRVLGKPRDDSDARDMLRGLSGKWHSVFTGVCLIHPDGKEDVRADESRVRFVDLDEAAIDRYVKTGEPRDKAGAYAVQGRAGMFVSRIEGSFSNVIGLPMHLVRSMLLEAGISNL